MGHLNDGLNESQLNKKDVSIEDVDQKGMVKRQRVNDQTIFDYMFINEMIGLDHHEAVHLFINDLSKSGTDIKSADMTSFSGVPFHKKGDALAERRMIFSGAFRRMIESCRESDVKFIMRYCHSPYTFKANNKSISKLALSMKPCLSALSRYYQVSHHRDPRSILRSQVYMRK